jgi:hypothetical protein
MYFCTSAPRSIFPFSANCRTAAAFIGFVLGAFRYIDSGYAGVLVEGIVEEIEADVGRGSIIVPQKNSNTLVLVCRQPFCWIVERVLRREGLGHIRRG